MSGEITFWKKGAAGVSRGRAGLSVGVGRDTDGLTSSGRLVEFYRDMPTQFRRGARGSNELVLADESRKRQSSTEVVLASKENIVLPRNRPPVREEETIAEGVRLLDKPRKSADGRIVQRKLAWIATPGYIYVTTVERELKWVDGSGGRKLKPAGTWLIENRRRWRPVGGVASKRTGYVTLSQGNSATAGNTENKYREQAEELPDEFVKGAEAMSFLPRQVRGDIVALVKHPTYFDGRIVCIFEGDNVEGADHEGSVPDYYEVSLLRMDDSVAVVISANNKGAGDVWQVTQATYKLTTPEIESA